MNLARHLVERLTYPVWDRWNGTHDLATLRDLQAHDHLTPEALRDLQRQRLRAMLRHAYATVPFYRRRFDEAGFDPARFEHPDQLQALPVLTKTEINANRDAMISTAVDRSRLIRDRTSGSTGEPLRFFVTPEKKSFVRAATLRENAWLGCRVGDRILRFWGSPDQTPRTWRSRLTSEWVRRTRVVDAYSLPDEQIHVFFEELGAFRPVLVITYAKPVLFAAQYATRQGWTAPHSPSAIVITAEGLYPEQRRFVSEFFGCPVVNRYASREMGQMASGCGQNHRLHVVEEGVFLELLPLDGGGVDDERGRIVVTDLVNEGMPFIRYETGDIGLRARGACSCGRPYGLLEDVEGRIVDLLRKPSGGHVHGLAAFPVIRMDEAVKNFQIVQETTRLIRVKLVPVSLSKMPDVEMLRKRLQQALGEEFEFEFEVCESIPPATSGKHRFAISKVTGAEP